MKTNNLILTPTGEMTRQQWLDFRKPTFHAKKFLSLLLTQELGSEAPIEEEQFFKRSPESYSMLKGLFENPAWKDFIFPCVGGSEISSIVGLNPYKSVIELYYEKVGIKPTFDGDNAAMFWGRELEADIAEKWQYWEGSEESLINNFAAGNIVRRCRRLNAYVQNKRFPWVFVSLDRIINKIGEKEEGCLEAKTISGFSADQWENGIPPMYVGQLQTQLFATELNFGEIAILRDGRQFSVYPFDFHQGICERLQKESFRFFEIVKKGMEQYLLYLVCPEDQIEFHLSQIDRFSPEPDGSLSYEAYLKGSYKEQGFEIFGGEVELHLAKAYKFYESKMKDLEERQRECSNKLKSFMKDAARVSFGEEGFVSWKANVKGSRVFLVKVVAEHTFQPDPTIVKNEDSVKIEEPSEKIEEPI
jgi:putative phage-type endonuclease